MKVIVAGGGLAGSEAALYLANHDIKVELYEMRPKKQQARTQAKILQNLYAQIVWAQ